MTILITALYAEGRTDERFLPVVLQRTLVDLLGQRTGRVADGPGHADAVLAAGQCGDAQGTGLGAAVRAGAERSALGDDGARLRPWTIRVADPAELDELAADAGLTLAERFEDFAGTAFVAGESSHHVSVYRAR